MIDKGCHSGNLLVEQGGAFSGLLPAGISSRCSTSLRQDVSMNVLLPVVMPREAGRMPRSLAAS